MMDKNELPFTARDLRDALGCFPTGVAIITAVSEQEERLAATVSSFNSVSLDPPLVLFSLARSAKSLENWKRAKQFAVNVLGENQSDTSTRFARSMSDKWEGVDPLPATLVKAPLIRDALAHFECEMSAQHDGGDHIIFIGRVVHLSRTSLKSPRPLIFACGQYRRLDLDTEIVTPYATDQWLHGW
jgi:flavin reductase (DIM6/NTAB) family NADH-FMN oxidoreductase RutF